MNYQAAGPVVALSYGESFFVSGSVHAGGLIVNAMARQSAAPSQGASSGAFYKGEGMFVAPTVDIGYRYRRGELSVSDSRAVCQPIHAVAVRRWALVRRSSRAEGRG